MLDREPKHAKIDASLRRTTMAQEQRRASREVRKPKKEKEKVTAAAPSLKGALEPPLPAASRWCRVAAGVAVPIAPVGK